MNSYFFPFEYRGLVLNGHRTAAGLEDQTKLADTIRVDRFDPSRLQQRDQREALHLLTGGDLGDATAAFRFISLGGLVRGSTGAKLEDKISALMTAFDVEAAILASPSTDGVQPFTFTAPTEVSSGHGSAWVDPISGLSVGEYVVERFYARPATFPIITGRRSGGDTGLFSVELVCEDPRRYLDTAEAIVLNSGNGFSATAPNWNTTMGKAVAPIITIVMSGNGNSGLTLGAANDPFVNLVLNMSAAGAGTFVIDCATGLITKSGVHMASLRTSAVNTFPIIMPGGSVVSAVNTTNVTSITFGYRQARG